MKALILSLSLILFGCASSGASDARTESAGAARGPPSGPAGEAGAVVGSGRQRPGCRRTTGAQRDDGLPLEDEVCGGAPGGAGGTTAPGPAAPLHRGRPSSPHQNGRQRGPTGGLDALDRAQPGAEDRHEPGHGAPHVASRGIGAPPSESWLSSTDPEFETKALDIPAAVPEPTRPHHGARAGHRRQVSRAADARATLRGRAPRLASRRSGRRRVWRRGAY